MQCTKCGSETKPVSGVSKKTGKPWSGNGCLNTACRNIDFNNSYNKPSAVLPKSTSTAQTTVINPHQFIPHKVTELSRECCLDNAVKLAMHVCKPEGETAGVVMMAEVDAYYKSLLNLLNGNEEI